MVTPDVFNKLTTSDIRAFVQALNALHWKTDYDEFCRVLGLNKGSYSEQKYAQFEELCKALNQFNLKSLAKLVEAGAIADEMR